MLLQLVTGNGGGKVKTGIMGGTFDPPHKGHLKIARAVKRALKLDRVIFMVAAQPRLKANESITPAEHRVKMAKLAIGDSKGMFVSLLETQRGGTTYTIDTLDQLHRQAVESEDFFFILGWDNLNKFSQWHRPQEVIKKCFLVAVPRPGYQPPDISQLEKDVPGIENRLIFVDTPLVDTSSSCIREMVRKGEDVGGLVSARVRDYIKRYTLYLQ
jgi:nicotinate-nucleotide adenylyltransferase